MSASIDTSGLTAFGRLIGRATSGGLQEGLVRDLQESGPKIVADIRGGAHTKIQRRAAGTVEMTRKSDGIELGGGRGASLGATLFDGGEYGGRKSARVIYAARSPLGKAYVVRRRTTMQFLPHLGHEGYMFWPAVREWMPKLVKQQVELIEETMGGR